MCNRLLAIIDTVDAGLYDPHTILVLDWKVKNPLTKHLNLRHNMMNNIHTLLKEMTDGAR